MLQLGIRRDLYSELDRGARCREPRAYADQLRKHQQEGPLVITRGDGCRVYDNSGREYLESIAGLWCASLGFASERLAKVAYEQMRSLSYYHLYRHRSSEPAIALAEELLKIAPVPMARVLFQCSGSEANDTAIKLAWYY
jgi:4-aminobutyrate--pyruvate transaminase